METQLVQENTAAYLRHLASQKFGDSQDDDWWHGFHGYDVNVWYEESTGAFKATLYRYDSQRGETLTDQWQSLGIIKYKQKGNEMEIVNETEPQQMSLHQALLRINALEKGNEGLRARIDRDVANFDAFVKDVDAFLKGVVEEYGLEANDPIYTENLKQWVDRDILTNHFMSEVTYRVEINLRRVVDVTVKHPSEMGDIDIEYMLEQAFGSADGDPDQVDEDLGDSCEITDISSWSTDVEVEANAR